MYFPKYWAKAVAEGPNREGRKVRAEAWGWSDASLENARRKGLERAQALLLRLPLSRGPRERDKTGYYAESPTREPVLQDLTRGNVQAVVTRNSLGCEVLNTDGMAFADLDYVPARPSFFASLLDFGGKKAAERQRAWQAQTLATVRAWQNAHPSWSLRVYRTAGGLRLLATSKLLRVDTLEAKQWMEDIGADPLYQRLCQSQKSFRARLTPKPWRCGLRKPPMRSPWEAASKEEAMRKWLENYRQQAACFAVCEFLESVGSAPSLRESDSLVALHDARTSAASGLPLA